MGVLPTKLLRIPRQQGLALILVLWMLTLLMIMAGSFAFTIRRETAALTNMKVLVQARALAEAGINIAMLNLLPLDERVRWRSDSSLYEIELEGTPIRIRIADESGKLDLNNGDPNLLRNILSNLGMEEEPLDDLIAAILDWRDPDDIQSKSMQASEKEQYQKAGLNYVPPNKSFESIEELQMVLGMNPELYAQLEPLLTVYSQSNMINPAKASREILLNFPNVTPEMVEQYLQQRAENARAGLPELAPTWATPSTGASQVFEILAEAMPEQGISGAVSAIVARRPSRQGLPFSIFKWHKSPVAHSLFAESENQRVMTQ